MNKRSDFTAQEKLLFDALIAKGIPVKLDFCNKHKCVDLCIPEVYLNIEIDGVQHYTNPEQIFADILRDDHSKHDGFDTLRIPNTAIEGHLNGVVKAISQVVSRKRTLINL